MEMLRLSGSITKDAEKHRSNNKKQGIEIETLAPQGTRIHMI